MTNETQNENTATETQEPEIARRVEEPRHFHDLRQASLTIHDYLPITLNLSGSYHDPDPFNTTQYDIRYFFNQHLLDENFREENTTRLDQLKLFGEAYAYNHFPQDVLIVEPNGQGYPLRHSHLIWELDGGHLPAHLRHVKMPHDPIAWAVFAADPSIPRPHYMEKPTNRFAIEESVESGYWAGRLISVSHRAAWFRLIHAWLTAALDETNLTGEGWAILKRCVGYTAAQFLNDKGLVGSPTYALPDSGAWSVDYPGESRLTPTPDFLLANAGSPTNPASNYSKARAILGITADDLAGRVI